MTVRELIEELTKLDGEDEVVIAREDSCRAIEVRSAEPADGLVILFPGPGTFDMPVNDDWFDEEDLAEEERLQEQGGLEQLPASDGEPAVAAAVLASCAAPAAADVTVEQAGPAPMVRPVGAEALRTLAADRPADEPVRLLNVYDPEDQHVATLLMLAGEQPAKVFERWVAADRHERTQEQGLEDDEPYEQFTFEQHDLRRV